MKIIKKSILGFLILTVSASLVACGPKKENSKTNATQKIEYINELTKDNVEEVVIEYKEILTYYNDLKNNLKVLDDVSKNPDLERDAVNTKDALKNSKTLLSNTKTTYKPLVDARAVLIKMYEKSISMSDNVIKAPQKYQDELTDYGNLFKEFKSMMDQIRMDIKAIRGSSPTDEKNNEDQNQNNTNTDEQNNTSSNTNTTDVNGEQDNNSNSTTDNNTTNNNNNNNNSSNSNSNNSNNSTTSNSGSSNSNKPSNNGNNNQNDGFIPSVSSLNNNIRSEIKNAGYNAGASYRQSGGSDANLDQIAIQQFNDIEGDNPIQKNQISEARDIFVKAFKNAYHSAK